MTALAQIDDMPGSAGFSAEQAVAAEIALGAASAAVRAFCRRQFTAAAFTTRIRARSNWLLLAQRPVVSVQSVKVLVLGQPTTTTGWVWDGLDRVWVGGLGSVVNLSEAVFDAVRGGATVAEVAYTAGYAQVPDDVVAVTAGLAARATTVPSGGAFTQQAAGQFSYQVAPWAQGGPLSLSDADREILQRYRRSQSTIQLQP